MNKGMLRALGALGAVVALGVVAGGTGATASQKANAKEVAKITAEIEGKGRNAELFFEGAKSVEPGQVLKIKNNTNPKQVGPHTFSLVTKGSRPDTKNEIKDCSKNFEGICGAIAEWHEVNLETGEIGVNPVEAGKKGWDKLGNLKREGDSIALEKRQGESFKQKVSAKDGDTLYYICAVHANMQGKLKVEK